MKRVYTIVYCVFWVIYLAILIYLILFKASFDNTKVFFDAMRYDFDASHRIVYLIPFETTRFFLQNWSEPYAQLNIMVNIVLFMPFGFLFKFSAEHKQGILQMLLFAFIFSLCFEFIQFLYAIGEFDVDDIILNVLGAVIGYYLNIFNTKLNLAKRES